MSTEPWIIERDGLLELVRRYYDADMYGLTAAHLFSTDREILQQMQQAIMALHAEVRDIIKFQEDMEAHADEAEQS